MLTAPEFTSAPDAHAPVVTEAAVPPPVSYEYIRTPDGVVHAVLASDIKDVAQVPTAVSDAPKPSDVPKVEAQFYVWLANGEIKRVKESDLPTPAGTNAPFCHWQTGGNVFLIVGVYPVEDSH